VDTVEREAGGIHPIDLLRPAAGATVALDAPPGFGLTRLALVMMAELTEGPVVAVDARGWLAPPAGWEVGIDPDRLVVVRCAEPLRWSRAVAALLDGFDVVHAEIPDRIGATTIRRLAARARARRTTLLLRPLAGTVPAGVAQLRLEGVRVRWEGVDGGHGRLRRRLLTVRASGKAMGGIPRMLEIEDEGTNTLRVLPGLGAAATGRAAHRAVSSGR